MENQRRIERNGYLVEKAVIIDGLPGCGKTMLSPIIASLERVEKLSYAYEIEHFCQLNYLGKVGPDTAAAMIRLYADLALYNLMMSRDVNFRPSDVSSVFRDIRRGRYIRRLFQKGDERIPQRIKNENPILHLTTHRLTGISAPLFLALGKRATIIEVVRHPLYMIKQETLNMQRILNSPRHFTTYFSHRDKNLPYFASGWEELFLSCTPCEKAIYEMERLIDMTEKNKGELCEKYGADIINVAFESFVTDPAPYLERILHSLGTSFSSFTARAMKRQRVPRRMYSEGLNLAIYRRCGWQPPRSSSEREELRLRRESASLQAGSDAMKVLDRLCAEYEEKYMSGLNRRGEAHE